MIPMTGNLVQITLRHQRRLGADITPLIVLQILDPALQSLDDLHTLRH